MPTSHSAPWLSPDFATAAGNLSRLGALMLFAVGTWYIIPLAKGGWTPTDPIQNKPTEVWRALPNGTAQRVPATGGYAETWPVRPRARAWARRRLPLPWPVPGRLNGGRQGGYRGGFGGEFSRGCFGGGRRRW